MSLGQNKRYTKCTLFSFTSSKSSVLLSILDSYMNWNTSFVSLKVCGGFSIFNSVSFLVVYIFEQNALNLWLHSFQNQNRKNTHSFDLRPLDFKLQQALKFNNICVSWSSQKIDLETNFFKLKISKFQVCHFFSIVTFK